MWWDNVQAGDHAISLLWKCTLWESNSPDKHWRQECKWLSCCGILLRTSTGKERVSHRWEGKGRSGRRWLTISCNDGPRCRNVIDPREMKQDILNVSKTWRREWMSQTQQCQHKPEDCKPASKKPTARTNVKASLSAGVYIWGGRGMKDGVDIWSITEAYYLSVRGETGEWDRTIEILEIFGPLIKSRWHATLFICQQTHGYVSARHFIL